MQCLFARQALHGKCCLYAGLQEQTDVRKSANAATTKPNDIQCTIHLQIYLLSLVCLDPLLAAQCSCPSHTQRFSLFPPAFSMLPVLPFFPISSLASTCCLIAVTPTTTMPHADGCSKPGGRKIVPQVPCAGSPAQVMGWGNAGRNYPQIFKALKCKGQEWSSHWGASDTEAVNVTAWLRRG